MSHGITIDIKNLTIGYTGKHSVKVVAKEITESLSSGELTCLLGENGAGKSTLLRTLAGFQQPVDGDISIMGKPLKSYSNKDLARVISVVLTERTVLQNMTVEELTGLGRTPYTGFWGTLSEDDRKRVDEALEQIDGKGYLIPYLGRTDADGKPKALYKVGVNFDGATRTLGGWKVREG